MKGCCVKLVFFQFFSSRLFWGEEFCEGLVIDDYFAISKIPQGILVDDPAISCFKKSKAKYREYEVMGSDDKDIVGAREAKVIGAHIMGQSERHVEGMFWYHHRLQSAILLPGLLCSSANFLIQLTLCTFAYWGAGRQW